MTSKKLFSLISSLCLIFTLLASNPVWGVQRGSYSYANKKVVTVYGANSSAKTVFVVAPTQVRTATPNLATPARVSSVKIVVAAPAGTGAAGGAAAATSTASGISAGVSGTGGLSIQGSDDFKQRVAQAIALLQSKAPSHWDIVRNNLTAIVEGTSSGVNVVNGVFTVGQATAQTAPVWLAGTLVHDAYHVSLYRSGQVYMGESGERAALAKQKEALILMGAPAYMIAHVDQVVNTRYWEVPAGSRTW